jgi:hypothetical protein
MQAYHYIQRVFYNRSRNLHEFQHFGAAGTSQHDCFQMGNSSIAEKTEASFPNVIEKGIATPPEEHRPSQRHICGGFGRDHGAWI